MCVHERMFFIIIVIINAFEKAQLNKSKSNPTSLLNYLLLAKTHFLILAAIFVCVRTHVYICLNAKMCYLRVCLGCSSTESGLPHVRGAG